MSDTLAGLVLAGGRSSRLGGGDKTLRVLRGKPILTRVLERLSPQLGEIAISANGDPARFAPFALPILADDGPAGQAGPLAGLLAGLEWAGSHTSSTRLLTVAGDTPFLPRDLAIRLTDAVRGKSDTVAVAASGGRIHPVVAAWPLSVVQELQRHLRSSSNYRVTDFIERFDRVVVAFEPEAIGAHPVDPFFNINTPADLAEAEALLASAEG